LVIHLNKKKVIWIAILAGIIVGAAAAGSYIFFSSNNYASLTVAQLDARLLPAMKYTQIPDTLQSNIPDFNRAFQQVDTKYQQYVQDCPARSAVYCGDMSAKTASTVNISRQEFDSLMKAIQFTKITPSGNAGGSGSNNFNGQQQEKWQIFVYQNCSYPVTIGVEDLGNKQICYYSLSINK